MAFVRPLASGEKKLIAIGRFVRNNGSSRWKGSPPWLVGHLEKQLTLKMSMGTITKRDLVTQIADQTGLTQNQVFDVLQLFLEDVTQHLAQQSEVVLRNFGTFEVRVAKAKVGRNPNNPEKDVPIPARCVVKFKPGKELKERVAALKASEPKKKAKAK